MTQFLRAKKRFAGDLSTLDRDYLACPRFFSRKVASGLIPEPRESDFDHHLAQGAIPIKAPISSLIFRAVEETLYLVSGF